MASSPPNILVVDDEPTIRVALEFVLESEGYVVECVADGAAAVASVCSREFDLVIMDIRMPGMDGITALRAIRNSGSSVPVIVASSHGTRELTIDAINACANGFLTKPIQPDDVRIAAKRLLSIESSSLSTPSERALMALGSEGLQRAADVLASSELESKDQELAKAIKVAQDGSSPSQLPQDLFVRISFNK